MMHITLGLGIRNIIYYLSMFSKKVLGTFIVILKVVMKLFIK